MRAIIIYILYIYNTERKKERERERERKQGATPPATYVRGRVGVGAGIASARVGIDNE